MVEFPKATNGGIAGVYSTSYILNSNYMIIMSELTKLMVIILFLLDLHFDDDDDDDDDDDHFI